MVYTVTEFCDIVASDLNGFIDEIKSDVTRNVTSREMEAMKSSYPRVSQMLKLAMKKRPEISHAHVSTTTEMLLEYKLPGASSWCDVVLLGDGIDPVTKSSRHNVVIIELKDWVDADVKPGIREGLVFRKGMNEQHPSDQVKGYRDYCQSFHSAVESYNAIVSGCVYFTRDISLYGYKKIPNDKLAQECPMYTTENIQELADYLTDHIQKGNTEFATAFVNGYYKQNRNILKQVAHTLKNLSKSESVRPFVLLDKQREGFLKTLEALQRAATSGQKEVIVVQGPPGSGKSAIAINLWIEAAKNYANNGNVVYVTTSGSQNDNWASIFKENGKANGAQNFVLKATSFNPGMQGGDVKNTYIPLFGNPKKKDYHPEYFFNKTTKEEDLSDEKLSELLKEPTLKITLKYNLFREYLSYMLAHKKTRNYRPNLHFLSVVDEAHALINPLRKNYRANQMAGWCLQMGPQGWHIINESKVSVFFTDTKQSFRDNETTAIEDIEAWAKELGANVTICSLDGIQFRCAGSVDYCDWVDHLISDVPLKNAKEWRKSFELKLVDDPCKVEDYLRSKQTPSVRILSSYTKEWVSSGQVDEEHNWHGGGFPQYDFNLMGGKFRKFWNVGEYDVFVQARQGSAMAEDPLCEIGCPYVVRGFDYDYVGVLWLSDIVRRGNRWVIKTKNAYETAIQAKRKAATDEQWEIQKKRNKLLPASMRLQKNEITEYEVKLDGSMPATQIYFEKMAQAYRILMTRGIKGLCLYIEDKETRDYVESMLK